MPAKWGDKTAENVDKILNSLKEDDLVGAITNKKKNKKN
jgi:hypothetical protein